MTLWDVIIHNEACYLIITDIEFVMQRIVMINLSLS